MNEEQLEILDDIANKPWRAIRYLAEEFEKYPDNEYRTECAKEYRKLEAFYSNGGSHKIDELLADPDFNLNYPEYLAPSKEKEKDSE